MARKSIQERKEQLLKQLEDIKEAEKKAENTRLILIGRLIDSECRENENLKNILNNLAEKNLKKHTERKLFDLPIIKKETKK